MNRIHGVVIIRRRTDQKHYNSIQSYTNSLKEDFHNICGYCGKDMNIISCPAEKDHLIPESLALTYNKPELITDYNNLVYACRTCNQRKKNKWPFNNIDQINDGNTGYADPASDDYDNHLEFDNDGKIIAKTSIGYYMSSVFDFEKRLTEIWFSLSQLFEQVEHIKLLINQNDQDSELYKKYFQLSSDIEKFKKELKRQKEAY